MQLLTFNHDRHGSFVITTDGLDWAIGHYLPTSILSLQERITDHSGIDYSDIHNLTECLAILVDMEGPDILRPQGFDSFPG